MKKWLAGLVLGVYLVFGAVALAQPQIPPAPTSGSLFVQDYAGVLSPDTKTKISLMGSQLKGKTKAHVLVVTVKSLEGSPISDYSLGIMRQWGVGDKTLNNGVVMVIVADSSQPSPRYRIEVGYGLEGALPDGKVGRILDDYMLPYFQKGDYDQGILGGYQAVIGEVAKEYNVDININSRTVQQPRPSSQSWWDALPGWLHLAIIAGLIVLLLIDWLFFGGMFTFLILSMFRGGGGRGGGGGDGGGFGGGSGGGGGAER